MSPVDRARATVAVGLMGLGLHMAEHHLPVPLDITTPTEINDLDHIEILLGSDPADHKAWVESIHVDTTAISPRPEQPLFKFEQSWTGRLPETGVRVRLVWLLTEGDRRYLELVSA